MGATGRLLAFCPVATFALAAAAEAVHAAPPSCLLSGGCPGDEGLDDGSVSLRQLRGEVRVAAVSRHGAAQEPSEKPVGGADVVDAARASQDPGTVAAAGGAQFCCFSGSNPKDVCGSCYANAFAAQNAEYHNTSYCTQDADSCDDCGGVWCGGSQPEAASLMATEATRRFDPLGDGIDDDLGVEQAGGESTDAMGGEFCCFSGTDKDDVCGTCSATAYFSQGVSDSHNATQCTQSADECKSCGGTWCNGNLPDKADLQAAALVPQPGAPPAPEPAGPAAANNPAASEDRAAEASRTAPVTPPGLPPAPPTKPSRRSFGWAVGSAFCCFAGADASEGGNRCSTCYGNAFAVQGTRFHNSSYCAQSGDTCGDCGGSWCEGKLPLANTHADGPSLLAVKQRVSGAEHARRQRSTSEDDDEDFCCLSGGTESDVCGSCFANAIGKKGSVYHGSTVCTNSGASCAGCGGTWCAKDGAKEQVLGTASTFP